VTPLHRYCSICRKRVREQRGDLSIDSPRYQRSYFVLVQPSPLRAGCPILDCPLHLTHSCLVRVNKAQSLLLWCFFWILGDVFDIWVSRTGTSALIALGTELTRRPPGELRAWVLFDSLIEQPRNFLERILVGQVCIKGGIPPFNLLVFATGVEITGGRLGFGIAGPIDVSPASSR
jgi:hypothetical protein